MIVSLEGNDYTARIQELYELAFFDNSLAYEVDEHGIYWDSKTKKFTYILASGCSCWDGSYDEYQADTLSELEKFMLDELHYAPNITTTEDLIKQATDRYYLTGGL